MIMLKKIAHNSTIPALGGNHDLKALQNLIAAEKTVLISLQKLSVDYSKASEALRTWGLTEGDYLGGILSASTSILNHFSSALSQYATHGHSMRDHLKAIRTREESLDDLERRRRSILRKAEEADKKLSKMSPENKYFTTQTETLNYLRDDIQTLNSDIMSEEAALDKFKRSATKIWMGLKFGGLVECCQKGSIAGEFGRLAVAEISEEMSQPGLPRNFSYPQNKIEDFVAEAYRGVNMVTLSTFPSAELRDRGQYDLTSFDTPPAAFYISSPTEHGEYSNNRLSMSGELQRPPTSNNGSRRMSAEQPSQTPTTNDDNASYQANRPFGDGNGYSPQDSSFFQISSSSQQLGVNEGDNVRFTGSHYQQQMSQTLPSSQQHGANEGTVDDFGVNSTGPPYEQQFRSIGSPYPQQFSQGTVNPPFSQTLPPSQQLRVNEGAMDNLNANVGSTSPPYQQQFSQGSYSPPYQRQFSQGTTNPSFSQTLPSSRQLGANEGTVDDFGVNTHSSPPYQQRLSQGSSNSSFSQTLPPSHQTRVNGGTSDNFGRIVRPAAPPYEQQYFQTLPPSQQLRVNEGDVIDISPSFHSPHRQRFSQESVNSSFSQTLPPSQQLRVNEGNVIDIGPSIHSPRPQRVSQESVNSSFSQTLPPSQQPRVNEGAAGPNARSTGSQQFSQGTARSQTLPPSQQIRANEGAAMDNFGPDVRTTAHRPVSPLFSQTLPPSQKTRANEGAAVDNFGPNVRPTAHRPVSPLFSQTLPPSQKIRANEGAAVDNFGPNVRPTAHPQQETVSPLLLPPSQGNVNSSFSQTRSPYQQLREGALDNNFGSNVRLTGPADSSSTAGGRIATFQVQTRPAGSTGGYSLQDPYSDGGPPPKKGDDSSFSASVANALHEKFEDLKSETKMSPWVTHQFNDILESPPIIVEGTTRRSYTLSANAGSASGGRSDSPLPVTAPSRSNRQSPSGLVNLLINNTLQEGLPRSSIRSSVSSGLSVYHDALTAPVCEDPKNGETLSVPYSSSIRSSVSSEYHDALMAPDSRIGELLPPKTAVPFSSIRSSVYSQLSVYHDALEPECEESRNGETLPKTAVPFSVPPATTITTTTRTTALSAQNTNKEDNRHLRFGGVEDIDREIEKRVSLEKEHRVIGPRDSRRNSEANCTEINRDPPQQAKPTNLSVNVNNSSNSAGPSRRTPPNISSLKEDDKGLNAAAARETNLGLETLKKK